MNDHSITRSLASVNFKIYSGFVQHWPVWVEQIVIHTSNPSSSNCSMLNDLSPWCLLGFSLNNLSVTASLCSQPAILNHTLDSKIKGKEWVIAVCLSTETSSTYVQLAFNLSDSPSYKTPGKDKQPFHSISLCRLEVGTSSTTIRVKFRIFYLGLLTSRKSETWRG